MKLPQRTALRYSTLPISLSFLRSGLAVMLICHKELTPMGISGSDACVAQCHGWGVDQRCSSIAVCTCRRPRGPSPQYDRPSRALAWPCRRSLRAAYSDHSSLPPAARIRWPFVYNVQLDRLCFLVAPVQHANENPWPEGPQAKSHHAIWIRTVCREGRRTASEGRTTKGVIEDKLSPETLAKTLLLQLHRDGERLDDQ